MSTEDGLVMQLHPGSFRNHNPALFASFGPDMGADIPTPTDYVRALTEQIRAFVPQKFVVLGTDGYGRSDTREKLRHFFEVDRYWVTVAALNALAEEGTIERKVVAEALKKYNLDPSKPNPMTV